MKHFIPLALLAMTLVTTCNAAEDYQELIAVCDAFREKGIKNPMMGFTREETTSVFSLTAYPFFCGTVADDPDAVKKLNDLDHSAGEYMKLYQALLDGKTVQRKEPDQEVNPVVVDI